MDMDMDMDMKKDNIYKKILKKVSVSKKYLPLTHKFSYKVDM
jgi:hypothetical protein